MLVSTGISVSATKTVNKSAFYNVVSQPLNNGITNITVNETWDMTNDGGSIEIPIDVRRNDEWNPERIDTPIPEHPRHYNLHLLQDETLLQKFIDLYDGMDIIVYCKKGGRSWMAANLINDAGFTGTIYNMVGGITEWKASMLPTAPGGILNITVDDVELLCNDPDDGIQIPIDVRFDYEWYAGFIDTGPWPESPVWYPKPVIETADGLETFLRLYEGNEVVLYCKGGYRSLLVAYIIMGADFNGTIYNMLGGITGWQGAGYPIRNNTEADEPTFTGPSKAGAGTNVTFEISATDPEDDGVLFFVDWNDTTDTGWIGPFYPGETVEIIHMFEEKGKYTISAKAKDYHGNESDWVTLDIKIPRTRASVLNILEMLLERFPFASTVIKILLG
jgi:rhodanese-related sulfurtransferase